MNDLERLLRHRAWLRRLAARLVAEGAAADDVAQEVWLAALEKPPDPRRPARPWMLGVARRLASFRARTSARREARERDVARDEAQRGADSALERIELEQRLARAVLALPEPARSAVVLRYFEERSVAEVARELGLPEATVRTRTKRGIDLLRERLDREWGGRGAWCVGFGAFARAGRPEAASIAAGTTLVATWKALAAAAVALGTVAFFALRAARVEPPGELAGDRERVELEPRARAESLAQREVVPERGQRELDAPITADDESEGALPTDPVARFALVEPSGAPAAERRVALVRADGSIERGASDAAGRVEFTADGSSGVLAIERPDSLPFVAHVALLEGEERVDLPRGVELSGTLTLADGSPAADLALELASDHAPCAQLAELGAALDELELPTDGALRTDRDGRFAWRDLPSDWSGSLLLPLGWRFADVPCEPRERAERRIAAPVSDLAFIVERFPSVRGRVVDPETGAGVAGARVGISVSLSIGGFHSNLHTDQQGRFEERLAHPGRGRVFVTCCDASGSRPSTVEFGEVEIGAFGLDLGDLELARGDTLRFVVADRDGALIAGASSNPSPLASSNARGELAVAGLDRERIRLTVFADGYLPAPLDGRYTGANEPMRVVLERAAAIELEVRNAAGELASVRGVQLTAPHGLFAGEEMQMPTGSALPSFLSSRSSHGTYGYDFRSDTPGRLRIAELLPDRAFEVRALDDLRAVCATARVEGIAAGETRELVLELPPDARPLAGAVLDAEGRPLRGARVVLGEKQHGAETDAAGRFEFALLASRRVPLAVSKRGYVPRAFVEVPPERDGRVELRLERARDVLLELVDERGEAILGASARIASDPSMPERRFEARDDGRVALEDVPLVSFEVELALGDARKRREVPASAENARLVIARP